MSLNEKEEKNMSEVEKKALEEKEEALSDEMLDKVDGGISRLIEREAKKKNSQQQKK